MIYLIIALSISIIIMTLYIINNFRILRRVDYLENELIANFVNSLILLENILLLDSKGYFRVDDEVGKIFELIKTDIVKYTELISELDVNIDDNLIIQNRLMNIDFLQNKISELEKEERLFELQEKLNRKSNSNNVNKSKSNKIYISK